MRYIKLYTIIIFITVAVLVCGCTDMSQYISLEEYDFKVEELGGKLEEANNKNDDKDIEILELKEEVNTLETDLDLTEVELEKYRSLVNNLNELLSNVYIGYAENENYILDGFTAFSIEYKGKFYLITAGHCVEDYDMGRMTNFKFKANFSNSWIYPKLLAYENDFYGNRDYAIFYSDKIDSGLAYDLNNSYPRFILGNMNDNILKEFFTFNLIEGESGSPILDIDGEVTEIATGSYVDIDLVVEVIDNLE